MNLYRITFLHAAPKDTEEGIKTYLLAKNEEQVYSFVDKNFNYECWTEKDDEGEIFDIYDEDYEVIGRETFKEKMIRLNGEQNDEDADFSDSYYGITLFGWELVEKNTKQNFNHMVNLGVVRRINNL